MEITIPNSVYDQFYDLLCDEIDKKFYTTTNSRPTKGKRKMWENATVKITPEKTISASRHLFGATDDYFYRRHRESKNGKKVYLDFDPFIKALEFLKISLPEGLAKNKHITNQQKCHALLDQFLIIYPVAQETERSSSHSLVSETIKTFYNSISVKNQLSSAWQVLSPEYQKQWGLDYKKFEVGYTNCKGIRNLAIFNFIESSPIEIDCMVYYDDEIEAYSSPPLAGLDSLLVSDHEKFIELLNEMRANAKKLGINEFDNIELHKLFDPVASEYIWYKCKFSSEEHFRFFSTKKTTVVKRLYKCTCTRVGGKWFIERLVKATAFSSR